MRIAAELRARGRAATSPKELGNAELKDPELLKLIHDSVEPAVLVTFDNKMSVEHRTLLDQFETTLAVVDKDGVSDGLTVEQYWREVIHRHAHRFATQPAGSRFMYRQDRRRALPSVA